MQETSEFYNCNFFNKILFEHNFYSNRNINQYCFINIKYMSYSNNGHGHGEYIPYLYNPLAEYNSRM